jgi:hypothetical protein
VGVACSIGPLVPDLRWDPPQARLQPGHTKQVAEGAKGDQWCVADGLVIVGRCVFIPSASPSL